MTTDAHRPRHAARRTPGSLARSLARRWRQAAAVSLVATLGAGVVACQVTPTDPAAASVVDLRVLVVSTGPRTVDSGLELIARTLEQAGTPFDILDSSSTELTAETLRDGARGRYNGIVLTQADLYTPSGSGFTGDEWRRLHAYERDFGVREAIISGFPVTSADLDLDYGMATVGASLTTRARWQAPAGTGRLFSYVNTATPLDIPEYSVWATPRTDGTGPAVTPLLVDEADASHVLVSQLDYADGRQVLLSTVGNAWYRLHSNVLAYQFLDFATKGLFIGGRTVSLSTHSDDMFLADDLWDPVANRTDPERSYRMTPADLDATVAAQAAMRAEHPLAAGWEVQFPYNGVGASTQGAPNPRVTRAIADDTRLNQSASTRNYGRSTSLVVERNSGRESRVVIKAADVSAPAGTVTKAVLTVRVTSTTAGLPVQVCPLTQPWVEGSGAGGLLDLGGATWVNRATWTSWATAGGTVDAARCVPATLAGPGPVELDITPIWQAWADGSLPNHGVVIRPTATGQAQLASAEASSANRPTLGFDTTGAPDALTARAVQLRDEFTWVNHTYNALQMDRLCPDPDEPQPAECPRTDYQTAYDDIARNREVWQALGLPGYEEGLAYLLSDSHAGLHDRQGTEEDPSDDVPFPDGANHAFLQAAQDLGVRYIASDSSRPNQDREQRVPGFELFLLPRYPTNMYVNATTPEENVDEYNWIYHERYLAQGQNPCAIAGAICQPKTYDELLAWEADTTVSHMLTGRAWPHYFHQSNLRDYGGGRSLLVDWMDAVMTRYEQLFTLPVLTPTAHELGPDAEERLVAAEENVRGSVDLSTGVVTLQADGPARALVTGLAGGPDYGGQSVGKVDVDATPRTFTAEDQVVPLLPPPTPTTTTTAPLVADAVPATAVTTTAPPPPASTEAPAAPEGTEPAGDAGPEPTGTSVPTTVAGGPSVPPAPPAPPG